MDYENCRHLTVVSLHDTGPWSFPSQSNSTIAASLLGCPRLSCLSRWASSQRVTYSCENVVLAPLAETSLSIVFETSIIDFPRSLTPSWPLLVPRLSPAVMSIAMGVHRTCGLLYTLLPLPIPRFLESMKRTSEASIAV